MEEVHTPHQQPSALSCVLCKGTFPLSDKPFCSCGGQFEVLHDFSVWGTLRGGYLQAKFGLRGARLGKKSPAERRADQSIWRFRDLIMPGIPLERIVSRGEGNTPLLDAAYMPRTCEWLGMPDVHFKHMGYTPTGSFKDYGMTVAMTHAKMHGAKIVACASTGNTSASVASYAAAAGIPALILLSESGTAAGKIAQSLAYGAKTVMIRGDFDAALVMLREARDKFGLTVMNSMNPIRLEGQKAITFEFLEQLGWQAPDWVVVPSGNLGNASAVHKALIEAYALGMISKMPRIAMVQAWNAAPFFLSSQLGWHRVKVEAHTIATAVQIGDPVNFDKAKRAIIETRGVVERVYDSETLDAKAVVDSDGYGAEPGSCVAVAGLKQLVATGAIKSHEKVVVVLTGHVLKDTGVITGFHDGPLVSKPSDRANRPVVIDATSAALEGVLMSLAT